MLKLAIKVFKTRADNLQVAACALLCVADLCNSLKAHAIPHLPEFMPLVIKEMKHEERLTRSDFYQQTSNDKLPVIYNVNFKKIKKCLFCLTCLTMIHTVNDIIVMLSIISNLVRWLLEMRSMTMRNVVYCTIYLSHI